MMILADTANTANMSLDKIAKDVLMSYGIKPDSIRVVQSGSIKTVWKISAAGKQLCLKRLRQTMDKAQFSVNAQIYIKRSGGLVPGIILDKNNRPIVQYNDQLFVLYEWIDGKDLNFGNPAEFKQAVQGLARFHIATKGYKPDNGVRVSSKLGKWPEQYASMKAKLAAWKEIAAANPSIASNQAYIKYCTSMINIANQAIEKLSQSEYGRLAASGSTSVVLCHQDYGKGNALAAGNDVFILDLDGVTFDLPARDLRKIIGKQAENRGQWQAATINDIIGWYSEVNPLSSAEKNTVYIDLLFPHWFYGLVKNQFQGGKTLRASEIERIARLEEAKVPILNAIMK